MPENFSQSPKISDGNLRVATALSDINDLKDGFVTEGIHLLKKLTSEEHEIVPYKILSN